MQMPTRHKNEKSEKREKSDGVSSTEGFRGIVTECFEAEKAAAKAGHPWEALDIPDAADKAAALLEYIESLQYIKTNNPGEKPFERGGTTEENGEALGFDVDMLREGKIRFVEPAERAVGFFDDLKKDDKEKEKPAAE